MARPIDPERDAEIGASGDGAGRPPRALDAQSLDPVAAETQDRLWWAASVVYRRKWWILGVTFLVAAASVYLTLQIPNRYRAETRVLLPESGGGGLLAGALSNLPPAAAALIGGGGGGGFTRYMAILSSPTTTAAVVERFDLVEQYGLEDEEFPTQAAMSELADRAAFEVNLDFDYLGVSVLDEDPGTAAQMADYYVETLNERHIAFQSSSAAEYRDFLGTRLDEANIELDEAQAAMQALQERSGVIEPTAQAGALFSALGLAQSAVTEAEVQYQAVLSQFGPENPATVAARAAVDAARREVTRLSSGGVAGIPSIAGLPRAQREFAEVMQDLTLQRAIIETVQPLYEQAALQERREADAVQVLDPATPPVKKAEPRRSLIVLAATFSAFLVMVGLVLALAVVGRWGPSVLARLRTA